MRLDIESAIEPTHPSIELIRNLNIGCRQRNRLHVRLIHCLPTQNT